MRGASNAGENVGVTQTACSPADGVRPVTICAFEMFTRPWNLAIVAECHLGVRRFDDFQRRLGVSRKTLAQRLRSLVEEGVLRRSQYQSKPDRFEYRLTAKGRDLFPILMTIESWARRWATDAEPDGWHIEHALCQQSCSARVVCDRCAKPVELQHVRIVAPTHPAASQLASMSPDERRRP